MFSTCPTSLTRSRRPSADTRSSSVLRKRPSPAIVTVHSRPFCLSCAVASISRSQRFTADSSPMPTRCAGVAAGTAVARNRARSTPLRTTRSRAGTKKPRAAFTLSAATLLLQIWSAGQRALSRPSTCPHCRTPPEVASNRPDGNRATPHAPPSGLRNSYRSYTNGSLQAEDGPPDRRARSSLARPDRASGNAWMGTFIARTRGTWTSS